MAVTQESRQAVEQEAREAYSRFVAMRDEIDLGERGWSDLADFFTEDAVYIDPAWGRQETREGIRKFFVASMAGLTGYGWSTPERWIMVDGCRVVSQWDQVLGTREDGSDYCIPGLSILYYAGDGLFCYSHDYLNMTHVLEALKELAWQPPAEFNLPPQELDWSTDLPQAWRHLATNSQAGQ
jgi:ketosteroid isomerase-like protein